MTHFSTIARDALFLATHMPRQLTPAEAVLSGFDFQRDDETTRLDFSGVPTQLGMRLTAKDNPAEIVVVIYRLDTEGWFITGASNLRYGAGDYIAAVQARIENNRARREATERLHTQPLALAA